ncbi:sensor histidine kinase [Paenibacillus kobensis]|uniref:sensor histidine kinase n=1 Tax=Paenibacillus kobensis TaxID=59841 RepID=UPI001FE3F593|nr:ATP-binding protein [Paenibacillus kobensis]
MGVDVYESNGKWIINAMDKKARAAQEGILPGDIVTYVDHQPVERTGLDERYGINSAKSITVMRDGSQFDFDFSDMSDRPIQLNQSIIPMLLFVLMMTFSSFIAYKKPKDLSASLLILFLMSVAVGYLSGYGNTVGDLFSSVILEIALTFAPVLFVHFVRSYFSNKGIYSFHKRFVYIGYWTVAAWNICYALVVSISGQTPSLIKNIGLLIFIAGTLMALLVQALMYIRYRNSSNQAVMIYMMIGNIASFSPIIILNLLPYLLVGDFIVSGGVAVLSFLFLPLTYLYLIISKQLFDIEFIVSRLRYYCMIALLPALLILSGFGVIFMNEAPHPIRWIQMFLVIYGSTVLFLYAKEGLDRKFRNKVIKGAHQFEQSLESFSRQVSEVMKVNELEQCLQKELLKLLPVESVGVIERHNESKVISLKRSQGSVPVDELCQRLNNLSGLSIGEGLKLTRGICYMIGHGRLTQHFIWIDDKNNHTEYNHDERMWMRTIITYVSFVYQNLLLIEGLVHDLDLKKAEAPPWVLRLLFRLSENERRKLASDLHDSALQDQLLWFRKLEAVVNDEAALPTDIRSSLRDISEGLLDVIHQIRETCNELRPPFLQEMGAIEAIENLCVHTQLNANFTIKFDHQDFRVELDDEYVLTIYRITQELLRNGMKHSKASHVELLLYYEDHRIRYRYKDDGIGFETDGVQLSFDHMGLSGIRERVSALEGETIMQTAPGKGLEVEIILPLPNADKIQHSESDDMLDDERSAS